MIPNGGSWWKPPIANCYTAKPVNPESRANQPDSPRLRQEGMEGYRPAS